MKRFLIITIIFLSCELTFAQDQLIKAAPFHFFFGGKIDYEYAYKQNSSIGMVVDYFTVYKDPTPNNGLLFKPYYRFYFGRNTMPSRGFYLMPTIYLGQTNTRLSYGGCSSGWFSFGGSCFDSTFSLFTYGAGLEIGWQDNLGPQKRMIFDFSLGLKIIPLPASVPKIYTNQYGTSWNLNETNFWFPPFFESPGWNDTYAGFPFTLSFLVGYKIFKSD